MHQVVRIEDADGVIALFPPEDAVQGEVQHLPLGGGGHGAVQHRGTGSACGSPGAICAVVGHHDDIKQLLGIILGQQAFHQPADDRFLIAGGHQNGKAGLGGGVGIFLGLLQGKEGDDEEISGIGGHSQAAGPGQKCQQMGEIHWETSMTVRRRVRRVSMSICKRKRGKGQKSYKKPIFFSITEKILYKAASFPCIPAGKKVHFIKYHYNIRRRPPYG